MTTSRFLCTKIIVSTVKNTVTTRQHSSRKHTTRLETIHVSVATTRCRSQGVGLRMNKFEQVSNDHHQCHLQGARSDVGGGWGRSNVEEEGVPYYVTYPMMYLMLPMPPPLWIDSNDSLLTTSHMLCMYIFLLVVFETQCTRTRRVRATHSQRRRRTGCPMHCGVQ